MITILEQAAAFIKAGDLENGKKLLIQVIQQNPRDENAWLWMSRCVTSVEQKRECFQRALNINPINPHAIEGLRRLDSAKNIPSKQQKQGDRQNLWIIGIVVLLLLFCVGSGIIGIMYYNRLPGVAFVPIPTNSITPTFTLLPTAELPTVTSTPTIEDTYCSNFTEASSQFLDFSNAISEWNTFLSTPVGSSYNNGQSDWASFIDLAVRAGPLLAKSWIQSTDPNIRNGLTNFMTLTQNLEEKGTKLQIKLSSVIPPQSVKLSHEKTVACVEATTTIASSYVNFFNYGKPILGSPILDECTSLGIYLQEINNFCNK